MIQSSPLVSSNGFTSIYDGSMSDVEILDWIIGLTRQSGNERRIATAATILRERLTQGTRA